MNKKEFIDITTFINNVVKANKDFEITAIDFFRRIRSGEIIVVEETPFSNEVAFIFSQELQMLRQSPYRDFVKNNEKATMTEYLKKLKISYFLGKDVEHYFEWAEYQMPAVYRETIKRAMESSIVLIGPNPEECISWKFFKDGIKN